MLLSFALILLCGMAAGFVCKKIRFPALFGMILAGIALGPFALNLIDSSVLDISAQLRKIALVVVLIRAGLKLSLDELKKVGRPAVLMCFVPACFEIGGMVLIAPAVLGISVIDAAILGAVIAAVSPAVIVPKMIKLIDEKYGTDKAIPQMILAGASVDDVFVIVLFTTFTGLAQGESVSPVSFAKIPVSIILGIAAGLAAGLVMYLFFKKMHIRDTVKVLIVLCIAFLLCAAEDNWGEIIPFASLIGVMAAGLELRRKAPELSARLSKRFDKIWVMAEIILFVLVGASVNITSAMDTGLRGVLLILAVLVFRIIGVLVCLIGTKLNLRERIFCMLAYTPKATVQAAIGGLPLAMGLSCGNVVLTVSVIAILLTAPLGAFAIDLTHKKFLRHEE
ncbi:MAG: cation:proton antiporter [Oscillospiraceae bacterium]|nr:cation:proton antiporter [Oscillospiraceae bacterium]